jgi:uncharacterized protein
VIDTLAMAESSAYGPLRLLVVQPTPFCNLDCDYCYLPGRKDRRRLSLEHLELSLHRVLDSPFVDGPFTLLWHAGEPLTMPIRFYDDATQLIRRVLQDRGLPPETISQSVQTNAVVINDAWCDCFQRNDIHVGVSMDGPAFLHDAHRRTRTGLGSHAAVMRGIAALQQRAIPFQVICVLTEAALDHADGLFDFFLEHGLHDVGFNMEEKEGENLESSLSRPDGERRYQAFLERFWQRTMAQPGLLRLREFEGIINLACEDDRLTQTDMTKPFVIVNVDANGNLSTFDPELLAVPTEDYGDFVLGNVRDDSLEALIDTEKFQRIQAAMAAGVEQCRTECDYFGLCGGGAGSNKYWENGSFATSETQACRYRIKLVADVVLAGMEEALAIGR